MKEFFIFKKRSIQYCVEAFTIHYIYEKTQNCHSSYKKKVVLFIKVLFDKLIQLKNQIENIGVIMSDNTKFVWEEELKNNSYKEYPFTFYNKMDFMAPFCKWFRKL